MDSNISLRHLKDWFVPKQLLFAWYRHYKVLFFFCFCIVLGFGGVAWYHDLYRYSWTGEEKKAFLDTYAKETNFKEAKFRETVDRLNGLRLSHDESPSIKKDVFTGESLP